METKTDKLSSMLSPRSIAIIGASGDERKIGYKPVSNLKEIGYDGSVFLVNPKYEQIAGYPCYKDIESLPTNIDLVLVSVSAANVMGVLHKLRERAVRSVIILSSGYAEVGEKGALLQQEISDFSEESNIPICGPNTIGLANFKEKSIASFSSLKARDYDPIAFVTQSGALGTLTYTLANEMGVGFQYFVSSGNEAGVDFFDYVKYFSTQSDIKVIGGYLEGARDFSKMDRALTACVDNNKPLVLMKVGNSEKGADAASSHTASIAGNAEVYRSYLEMNNVVRVSDEEELTDTLAIFNKTATPKNPGGVAIVTQSGGAGIIMSDQCEQRDITLANLTTETTMKLKDTLPDFASIKNPIDITAQVSQEPSIVADAVEITLRDKNVESVILYLQMTDDKFLPILPRLSKIAKETDKRLIFCWAGIMPETKAELFKYKNICWIPNPTRTINALSNVTKYYNRRSLNVRSELISRNKNESYSKLKGKLNEWESKQLLNQHHVSIPEGKMINQIEELRESNLNYPLVMKAVSSEIEHKSDYGLVQLNISTFDEAVSAYKIILNNKQKHCNSKKLDGVLIEEMAPKGIEVIIGAVHDKFFGPCIMFGLGGIFVEVMKDVVVLPAPLNHNQAIHMIHSIKNFKVLDGARGDVKYDLEALADVIVHISELCMDKSDSLVEFDINPLIVHEKGRGVTAVDAFIVGK
ncbi:acetate--CoA ligase family protein [Oceanobacillus senegalensis]|uniref:acetate--CoA ligase family protein n=1 Tax=Oceanobacillus senegalensis TaxID=1936063 RepID=UPI000A311BE6|nr:acetate--CoA ligase family protein [Oceanobacillus senegalensis]